MTKTFNIIISSFEIILVILIGICTLIYEEIIVINLCGLEKNVRDSISRRASSEMVSADYYQLNPINE